MPCVVEPQTPDVHMFSLGHAALAESAFAFEAPCKPKHQHVVGQITAKHWAPKDRGDTADRKYIAPSQRLNKKHGTCAQPLQLCQTLQDN